ncbi:MAG: type II toxin-antitoxin system Phd/YefM family antitoxin [Acidiferrobacter sp.]
MRNISLAEAKAHLSAILNEVEVGGEVIITRHGKPVARIVSARGALKPLPSLAAFRAGLPRTRTPSAELLRGLRDEGY